MTIQVETRQPVSGYGTLAVNNASVALSTITVAAGAGLPNTPTEVTFFCPSGGTFYISPLGGTASATVGVPVPASTYLTLFIANPSAATVFTSASLTLTAQW